MAHEEGKHRQNSNKNNQQIHHNSNQIHQQSLEPQLKTCYMEGYPQVQPVYHRQVDQQQQPVYLDQVDHSHHTQIIHSKMHW